MQFPKREKEGANLLLGPLLDFQHLSGVDLRRCLANGIQEPFRLRLGLGRTLIQFEIRVLQNLLVFALSGFLQVSATYIDQSIIY